MKRILFSIATLSLVVGGLYGSIAYFSDTETSEGNSIVAGTIDIAVDGENPWGKSYTGQWGNFMPGDHPETISFTVKNVGNNPATIWKQFQVVGQNTGTVSEPECTDQGGEWKNSTLTCDFGSNTDNNNLAAYLNYDMTVGSTLVIDPAWGVRVKDIRDLWVPVATLKVGEEITITQNYVLDASAGNALQGDVINFNIVLYAEQYMGTGPGPTTRGVVLDNKTSEHWFPAVDNTLGILTWNSAGDYTLKAWGLNDSDTYRVAYWDGSAETGVSSYAGPSAGELTITGTYAGFTTNTGAKYWLRPADWDNAKTLWEANLVN